MADNNTVSWITNEITLDDGSIHTVKAGTSTDDVAGGLVDGTPYFIYWTQSDPTKFHTVIASDRTYSNFNTLIATATGAASGYKSQIKYAGSLATDGQDFLNANQVVNQDSVTGTEIGTVGSTATTGLRMKMSTAGTGAAGSGSTGNFFRGYKAASVSDTTGRWLDIDGDDQSIKIKSGVEADRLLGQFDSTGIHFMDGSANEYILSGFNATGMKFYAGTAAAISDGTTRAHYSGSSLTFYNASGLAAGNELLSLGVGSSQGLNLYGSSTSLTSSTLLRFQSRVGGSWVNRGYHGLWTDGNDLDHLLSYTPNSKVYMVSGNAGSSATDGSTIHFQTGEGLQAGWKMHASSDSTGTPVFRNYFFPVNSGAGTAIAGDVNPDGTSDEPFNYIGFQPGDTRDGQGTIIAAPTIAIVQSYYSSLGDGSAALPALYFDQNTGVYSDADNSVAFSAGGTKRAHWNSSGTTLDTLTVASGTAVVHNGGLLTAASSSIRYKDTVLDLETDTTDIYNLRPVSFKWKGNGQADFGLIAEEVDKVLPMLVHYDNDVPESVAYDKLSVLLLMEVKKLREEIKELKENL